MDKYIHVYTHMFPFMCVCDNISVPKHVHICMHILLHIPYPCRHVHNKNVSIYGHLNPFAHTGKYHTCGVNTIRYLNCTCKLTLQRVPVPT